MTRKIRNYTIVAICSVFMVGLIGGTAMAGSDNLHYKGGQYYYDVDKFDGYETTAQAGGVQDFNTKSPAVANGADNMHYQGGQYYNGAAQSGNVADTQSVQQFNTKSRAGNVGGDNMHYQGGQYYYDVAKFNVK